ncbi:nucleotide sugar dehydrogenase [Luteolibacter sp. GHJ8]|uniref:Nucleotide sugar dehydrogenase n=1 Tax=Luteolibacter rhizosphaerae TaxID=2989719 RepID=A0ABT3FYK5_9BACT|nr:nucleotide sugar dehydrogenase [Luteolibacter rhizosphaerae]MCW1912656.1 nucleotide sugar dehydrogenase [Luteolibacter rhizosphaerae]
MSLQKKFADGSAAVGVVGLGYVGLPLLLAYAKKGFRAVGIDIDAAKPQALLAGKSYIKHIPGEHVAEALAAGKLEATTDFSVIAGLDAIILCVPTPLDEHFEPDLSYVTDTVDAVVPHLKAGQVLSLESTTYPGTTDEEVVTRVEKAGFKVGTEIHVVYSPEREDPGNPKFSATNIPKVVGGVTAACLDAGVALYESAFEKIVPVSSCKVAELTKLLENIYRAVNIGLVNELKVAADRMGIDIWEVIRAASTKPFGFTPFYPGPGLGGHCIPIDPFYLTWKAREYGVHTRFIELAGEINRGMPDYVIHRAMEALNSRAKPVKGSKILLLGLAYKANVDDMRESPTFALLDGFKRLGAEVSYYDPHVPVVGPTREHMNWAGVRSVEWNEETIRAQDCIVISTHHSAFDLQQLSAWSDLIIDTRNAMASVGTPEGQVIKA